MIAATPNSNSSTTSENSSSLPNNSQTAPKFADMLAQANATTAQSAVTQSTATQPFSTQPQAAQSPITQTQRQTPLSQPGTTNNSSNGDFTQPKKKKINIKTMLGILVLFLVILGSGVGFYLTQYTQQDIRQQAYIGAQCDTDADCNANQTTPGVAEYCVNQKCTTTPPAGGGGGTTPPAGPTTGDDPGSIVFGTKGPTRGGNSSSLAGMCDWNSSWPQQVSEQNGVFNYESWNNKVRLTSGHADLGNGTVRFCSKVTNLTSDTLRLVDSAAYLCPTKEPSIACNYDAQNYGCGSTDAEAISAGVENLGLTLVPGQTHIRCDDFSTTSNSICGLAQADWKFDNSVNGGLGGGEVIGYLYNFGGRCESTQIQCNDVCTTNSQCGSNQACLRTYNWSGTTFENKTSSFTASGVPSGITSVSRHVRPSDNKTIDHVVTNGQVWARTGFDGTFTNATQYITNPEGLNPTCVNKTITGFSTSYDTTGKVYQYVVCDGQIWFRDSFTKSFEDRTSFVSGVGSGTIKNFTVYFGENGRLVQYLIRGGQIWSRNSYDNNQWKNVTTVATDVSGSGSGTVNSFFTFNNSSNNSGELIQFMVRNNQVLRRSATFRDNRCRLLDNPGSSSCEGTGTIYSCNSTCQTTPQCQGSLGSAYSCVSNKCRLTANPTSPVCEEPEEPVMCQDVALLDSSDAQIDVSKNPPKLGQAVKLRCMATGNTTSIDHYEFKIETPSGKSIIGSLLNPSGTSRVSLPYELTETGAHKAFCRVCTSATECQEYRVIN